MNGQVSSLSVESASWIIAGLFFGVGDVLTTHVGHGFIGVVEANPIAALLTGQSVLETIVLVKIFVFAISFMVWTRLPRPYSHGIPLGLAAVGVIVTAWNLSVLLRAPVL